mmetsp:Transcript_8267/g.18671  ORF Transcript_8267/g.18671 Transcript_8267/m.18671 type:complete len:405 (+) Transcript_8267:95-1309(+)
MTIIMGQDSTPEVTPIVNATAIQDYGGTEALVVQSGNTDGEGEIIPLVDVFVDDPNNPDSAATSTPKWRDLPFAILFWVHLAVMIWLGVTVAPKGYELFDVNVFGEIEKAMQKSDDVTEEDIQHFKGFVDQAAAYLQVYPTRIGLYCALPLCFLAFVFGLVGTSAVLKPCPRTMVYSCLVSTIAWTCIVLLGSAISTGSIGLYFMTGISLVAVGYYVRLAWKMVPFAAVNLKLALEGIGRNCGIFMVAFFFAEIGFLWVVYWFYVMIGTSSYENNKCQAEHPDQNFDMDSDDYSDVCDPPLAVVIFFLLSLYWTGAIFMVGWRVPRRAFGLATYHSTQLTFDYCSHDRIQCKSRLPVSWQRGVLINRTLTIVVRRPLEGLFFGLSHTRLAQSVWDLCSKRSWLS